MTKYHYIVIGILSILLVIILIRMIVKNYTRKKEMKRKANDRLREEALDRLLVKDGRKFEDESKFSATPVEVNYKLDDKNDAGNRNIDRKKSVIQVTEISKLSKKRYILNPDNRILIGDITGKNDIIISDPEMKGSQYEIFKWGEAICVKNLTSKLDAVLIRKNKKIEIGNNAVILKNKDAIKLGTVLLKIEILVLTK